MENILPNGPFRCELHIAVTDGEREAVVHYDLQDGKYPRPEDIKKAINEAVEETNKQTGSTKWRPLTKQEMFSQMVGGANIAMPGKQDFED